MTKKLDQLSTEELKRELKNREEEESRNEMLAFPTEYYQYEKVDHIRNANETDHRQHFFAHVDTGDEGHSYIIEVNHEVFNNTDDEDEKMINAVKHAFLTSAKEGGWLDDIYTIEDIHIGTLGHYGVDMLRMTIPKGEFDED